MSLYKTLASQFVQEIEDGKLSEGSRMPSLRQLAKQQAVSMSTAVSCYQELESQGWIHSRPQAGYYISARSKNTTRLSGRSLSVKYLKYTKASLFTLLTTPLGISSTTIDDTAQLELERSFRRSSKRLGSRLNHYPHTQGDPSLCDALSVHFSKLGIHINPQDLVITSGCMPAIKAALEACTQVGDAIAISSPCFSGYWTYWGKWEGALSRSHQSMKESTLHSLNYICSKEA